MTLAVKHERLGSRITGAVVVLNRAETNRIRLLLS
jgi:hypothetical protein